MSKIMESYVRVYNYISTYTRKDGSQSKYYSEPKITVSKITIRLAPDYIIRDIFAFNSADMKKTEYNTTVINRFERIFDSKISLTMVLTFINEQPYYSYQNSIVRMMNEQYIKDITEFDDEYKSKAMKDYNNNLSEYIKLCKDISKDDAVECGIYKRNGFKYFISNDGDSINDIFYVKSSEPIPSKRQYLQHVVNNYKSLTGYDVSHKTLIRYLDSHNITDYNKLVEIVN